MGVVDSMGVDVFVDSIQTIRDLSEAEMRRRIGLLSDGTYRAASWTEWEDEFFKVPCELTVDGIPGTRACMTHVRDGLRIETSDDDARW